jgi:hypothetical protein
LFWHLARRLNEKITAASPLSHLDKSKGEPKKEKQARELVLPLPVPDGDQYLCCRIFGVTSS